MKHIKQIQWVILLLCPVLLNSCFTSILTYVPSPEVTTTTTVKTTKVETVITSQITTTYDLSFYLDLRGIGAAFAQANSVQEFEMLLNSSRYMLSNLDLNRDGFVDYLRVIETYAGYNHVLLVQAVLGINIYQDVATIVVEAQPSRAYVQVIGAPFIYGNNYIIEPVFVKTPPMYAHFSRVGYKVWTSPYYWDHFPSHYAKPKPQYMSHYRAYMDTYMKNHTYCHDVRYADKYHYPDYMSIAKPHMHNDYGTKHPNESFNNRQTKESRPVTHYNNARDLPSPVMSADNSKQAAESTTNRANVSDRSTHTPSASQEKNEHHTTPAPARENTNVSASSRSASQTTSKTNRTVDNTKMAPNADKRTAPTVSSTTVNTHVRSNGTTATKITTIHNDGSSSSVKRPTSATSATAPDNTPRSRGTSGGIVRR